MCIFLLLPSCFPGFAEIIWNYRHGLLLNLFLHNTAYIQNSFLTKCIRVCSNHVISSYLALSFTGFIAHCYSLHMTSFPSCIFWSNFHLTGLLPLVMASEME